MNEQLDLFSGPYADVIGNADYDYGGARRYYKFYERGRARSDFKAVFDVDIAQLIGENERMVQFATKRIMIDPFKFDDVLHGIYGDYENEGMSMRDLIEKHYGKKGVNLFMALTHGALSGEGKQ